MIKSLILIIVTVCLNTTGQFLMKAGVNRIGKISILHDFFGAILKAVKSTYVIGGFGAYAVSAVLWIIILSREDLSWAFPMVSLSYVITALVAPKLLNEPFSIQRLVGTLVICAGVFLVSKTK
jgi:drug/metabolite transporter (DMT)-like permease